MTFRPVLLLCLLAAPLLRADYALLDLLPPGTTLAVGVRVRNLVDSPIGKQLAGEMRKASVELNQVMNLNGFDPFQDIDEVLIVAMGEGKNAPGLMIVRGRFENARKKAAGTTYKGVPLSGKMKSATAFLDDSTVVAGDLPLVRAAIERRNKPSTSPLREKLADLAGRYDLYGFGKVPAGAVPADGPASAAKGIEEFQFGATISSGVDLSAELKSRTEQEAQALAQTMQLLTAMAAQQQGGTEMAKNLSVKRDGRTLRISLAVSEADLMKTVETRRAAAPKQRPAERASTASPFPVLTRTPAPPKRDPRFSQDTVLVITGSESDGGTIVIKDPKR